MVTPGFTKKIQFHFFYYDKYNCLPTAENGGRNGTYCCWRKSAYYELALNILNNNWRFGLANSTAEAQFWF